MVIWFWGSILSRTILDAHIGGEMIYLQTIKKINNLTIKERYGKDFRRIKRYQNIPRYTVWTFDGRCLEEFYRLSSAKKFCRNTKDFRHSNLEDK